MIIWYHWILYSSCISISLSSFLFEMINSVNPCRYFHNCGNNRFLHILWSKSNHEESGNWQIRLMLSVAICNIFRFFLCFRFVIYLPIWIFTQKLSSWVKGSSFFFFCLHKPDVLGCKCYTICMLSPELKAKSTHSTAA